jgi:hypothetical protein
VPDSDSGSRLAHCELEIVRLRKAVRITTALGSMALVALLAGFAVPRSSTKVFAVDTLRVSEVAVVDEHGVVRARLGGNLPDATTRAGRPIPRGDKAAGLLIYDDRGAERGGYVTFEKSGTAALTLDTRGPQVVLLAADSLPGSGAALRLWTGNSWVEVRADEGGPRFSASRDGHVVFAEPPATDAEQGAFCREFKGEVAQAPKPPSAAEILAACKAHRTERECTLCLGKP